MCDDDLEKLNTYIAPSSFDLNGSYADIISQSEDSADTTEVVEEVVPVIPVDRGTCYSKDQFERGCNEDLDTVFCKDDSECYGSMTCSRRRACIGDAGCEANGNNCWYYDQYLAC